jgi:hypothetical protein
MIQPKLVRGIFYFTVNSSPPWHYAKGGIVQEKGSTSPLTLDNWSLSLVKLSDVSNYLGRLEIPA